MREAHTQGYIVNQPREGGFGCITFDYLPDGTQVTFIPIKSKGHIEDRVTDEGVLVAGYATILLQQSARSAIRVVA